MNRKFNLSFRLWITITMVCISMLGYAQNRRITGTVKEASGETIIGATVMVKGTTTGTVTDFDGNYTIEVPANAKTLVFSYVGMQSRELEAQAGKIDVVLTSASQDLDEVVVIGYGTAKKRDLTGSVSSVGAKSLKDLPVASAGEALQGKMAGVSVTTTDGSPDAEIKIRVRGGGSITQESAPLYIVDGFPVSSIGDIPPSDIQSIDVLKDASSTAIYGSRGANGVIIITTKSAKEGKLSISYNGNYGFKQLAKKLDVLSVYDFAYFQRELAVLKDGNRGVGTVNSKTDTWESYFGPYSNLDSYKNVVGTDWQDEAFGRTGSVFQHNVSLSGGSDKISFNLSYNRMDDKAIMMESAYSRDNLNFKMNAKPIDRVKIDFTARYSNTYVEGGGANEGAKGMTEKATSDSRLKNCIIYTPVVLKNRTEEDATDEEEVGSLFPPTVSISDNYQERRTQNYNFNGGISVDIIKGLTARVELGYDGKYDEKARYYGLSTYYVRSNATYKQQPAIELTNNNTSKFRNTNTVNYDIKHFMPKGHSFNILLGEEMIIGGGVNLNSWIENMPTYLSPSQSFGFTGSGTPISNVRYVNREDKLLSFFARANYDYQGRYLVSATFRADGSSKFAPGKQWGYFPSVSAAWRISDESFLEESKEWLSNLKLRLSYGMAGNNDIPAGQYLRSYTSKPSNSYISESVSNFYYGAGTRMANENLRWETTITRNIGVDFGFFNNRLSGTIEGYWNNTQDLLIDFPVPGSGYGTQYQNVGSTQNLGVELSLTGVIIDKKDYSLEVFANIGANFNKVVDLGGLSSIAGSSGWNSEVTGDYMIVPGQPLGQMYGYVTDGRYTTEGFSYNSVFGEWVHSDPLQEASITKTIAGKSWGPGALKFKDIDGYEADGKTRTGAPDGKIDGADMTVIGNSNPLFAGGFGLSARIKWVDISANFTYSYGNQVYNANKLEFTSTSKYEYRNMISEMTPGNYWTNMDPQTGFVVTDVDRLNELNANTTLWSPVSSRYVFHSWAVEDASFLRLSNLTVGVSLPQRYLKKIHLQQVRLYFTGYNLFVATAYTGYDPEVDSRRKVPYTTGVDYSAYPKSRSYNFGVNLTF